MLGNGNLVLLDKSLIYEAVFLIELVDSACDDLIGNCGRLALVDCLNAENLLLCLDLLSGNRLSVEPLGIESCDLHADVTAELYNCLVVLDVVGNFHAYDYADLSAAVDIADILCAVVKCSETTNLDVLTDCEDLLVEHLGNCEVALGILALGKSLNCIGLALEDSCCDTCAELLELLVLCDKVCLGVDLNYHSLTVICNICIYHTLGCNTACLLGCRCKTLFSEECYSAVKITVALCKSFFTIHHTRACHLAQAFYICSCKCHFDIPPLLFCI